MLKGYYSYHWYKYKELCLCGLVCVFFILIYAQSKYISSSNIADLKCLKKQSDNKYKTKDHTNMRNSNNHFKVRDYLKTDYIERWFESQSCKI